VSGITAAVRAGVDNRDTLSLRLAARNAIRFTFDLDEGDLERAIDVSVYLYRRGHSPEFKRRQKMKSDMASVKRTIKKQNRQITVFKFFAQGFDPPEILEMHGNKFGCRRTLYNDLKEWRMEQCRPKVTPSEVIRVGNLLDASERFVQ